MEVIFPSPLHLFDKILIFISEIEIVYQLIAHTSVHRGNGMNAGKKHLYNPQGPACV